MHSENTPQQPRLSPSGRPRCLHCEHPLAHCRHAAKAERLQRAIDEALIYIGRWQNGAETHCIQSAREALEAPNA